MTGCHEGRTLLGERECAASCVVSFRTRPRNGGHVVDDCLLLALGKLRVDRKTQQVRIVGFGNRRRLGKLNTALATRPVIEQAKGMIMLLRNWNAEQAFAALRRPATTPSTARQPPTSTDGSPHLPRTAYPRPDGTYNAPRPAGRTAGGHEGWMGRHGSARTGGGNKRPSSC
ncbi:ANTAR domain-containing protein [Amycolatopsis orientalis]|uniref:ANTAR domain-containing protein n=1 Tax=Amycolatopsis orientalis TaxID=31958 RepID=UPI0009F626A5|nr:ANTAR domain-containing protein [Amycolatopsis orientalis]